MLEALQVLFAWMLADLMSGSIHVAIEHCGRWRLVPVIGPLYRDFMAHHDDPLLLPLRSVWGVLWAPALCALPVLIGAYWLPWLCLPLYAGLSLSTVTHLWAHRLERPWPVRLLQRCRIVLTPTGHERHHQQAERHYCVLNGWCNPLLDAILDCTGPILGDW